MTNEPKRLHFVSILFQIQKMIMSMAIVLVPLAFQKTRSATPLVMIAIPTTLLIVFAVVRWRRFRYWVADGQLRAVEGGLFKKEIQIPLDKVQAVETSASILHRMFGVVRTQIKTAASGTQLDLTAISHADLEQLRAQLDRPPEKPEGGAASEAQQVGTDALKRVQSRWTLSAKDVMVAAATSRQFLIALAAIGWLQQQVGDYVGTKYLALFFERLFDDEPFVWSDADFVILAIVAGVVVLAWLGSVVYTVLTFRSYAVWRDERTIHIRRGLTEVREVSVPFQRVQAIEFEQTPLQLLLGYASLTIRVVGHAEEKGANTVIHPCLSNKLWQRFLEDVCPGFALVDGKASPPARAIPRFVFRKIRTPVILLAPLWIALTFIAPPIAAGALILLIPWIILATGAGLFSHRAASIGYDDTTVMFRTQGYNRRTVLARRGAFQRMLTSQNLFQRRLALADFGIEVASGNVGTTYTVPDLDGGAAGQASDWLLKGAT